MEIGALYKVKLESIILHDNKERFEATLKRGDVITLLDINNHNPIVLYDSRVFELVFDYYHPDSFTTFFAKVEDDEIQS